MSHMATKPNFKRSGSTIKTFDGAENLDEASEEHSTTNGTSKPVDLQDDMGSTEVVQRDDSNSKALVQASNNAPYHLLLVSMLEHVCSVYVSEPSKSRQVFKGLHKELVRLKILSPLGGVDELSSIRSQYKVGFAKLVQAAIDMVYNGLDAPVVLYSDIKDNSQFLFHPRDLVKAHQRLNLPDLLGFQSRYEDEFIQLGHLGRGAYGSVFKCQHKLDGCFYAIKKIAFQDMKPELWFKVLREVKYLAGLNHKYVVRYHGAWFEYQNPVPTFATVDSTNFPAIKSSPEDSDSSSSRDVVAPVREDDSLDIVFERESSRGSGDRRHVTMYDLSEGSSLGINQPASRSTAATESAKNSMSPLVLLHIQMEICDKTLKEWISSRNYSDKPYADVYDLVDENQNQIVLKQILKGLQYIHSQNLIHRDLKPKNIFLMNTSSGALHAKVGDFGLARHVDSSDVPLTPHPGRARPFHEENMYTSGVGTTIYASPEQLEGNMYNSKSDMYSLGLIMLELYHPFHTEMERLSTLNEARRGVIPSSFFDKWPMQGRYLTQLLDSDPVARPSAHEMLESDLFLSKNQMMVKLQEGSAQKSLTIKEQKETINKLQTELAALRLQLHQKDQLIAVKDRQLDERGKLLDALTKQL